MKPARKTIASLPSWVIRNDNVELALTELGGQMAPVTFCRDAAKPVQPYYINPWHAEGRRIDDPVMVPLRGDFFCMPFGANVQAYRGEQYFCHGEPATKKWSLVGADRSGPVTTLTTRIKTVTRPGTVTKHLRLMAGHNVVYSENIVEGYTGAMPMAHHPILPLPKTDGGLLISTSPFQLGMTNPDIFADPTIGMYQSFPPGKRFTSLSRVPLMWKDPAIGDSSALPVRDGFTDLLAVYKKPTKAPAWTAAVNTVDGFLWFSLKDAAVLPATVMWVDNCGDHTVPCLGRNRCVGLEDVCAFFADGLVPSIRPNCVSRAGFPTAIKLSKTKPTAIRHIQGVVKVPRTFGRVRRVSFAPGKATFVSTKGKTVTTAVCHEFLAGGDLG